MLFGLQIAAITSVALCVIPAGAHFFERANKMALSPADYMSCSADLRRLGLFRNRRRPRTTDDAGAYDRRSPQPDCRGPLVRLLRDAHWNAGDLLDVDLSHECRDAELDQDAGGVRGGATSMGRFACRGGRARLCGAFAACRLRASSQFAKCAARELGAPRGTKWRYAASNISSTCSQLTRWSRNAFK